MAPIRKYPLGMRQCNYCRAVLVLDDSNFYKNKSDSEGYQWYCKRCSQPGNKTERQKIYEKQRTAKRYGLTLHDVEELLRKQNNSCAICKESFTSSKETNIDHDHVSNRVRGLLCGKCNRGLGNFRDDVAYLQNAIDYLLGL